MVSRGIIMRIVILFPFNEFLDLIGELSLDEQIEVLEWMMRR